MPAISRPEREPLTKRQAALRFAEAEADVNALVEYFENGLGDCHRIIAILRELHEGVVGEPLPRRVSVRELAS